MILSDDDRYSPDDILYSGVFRDGYRTAATSKIELFVIIVNGFQPLTIIIKCLILDVAVVLDPPLIFVANF